MEHGAGKVLVFVLVIPDFVSYGGIGGVKKEERVLHPCTDQEDAILVKAKHVPGDQIIAQFNEKDIGDSVKGKLSGVPFYIFDMKESWIAQCR